MEIKASISVWDLADALANERDLTRDNYAGLIALIADIDDSVDDLQFTKALHSRLSGIIAECEDE